MHGVDCMLSKKFSSRIEYSTQKHQLVSADGQDGALLDDRGRLKAVGVDAATQVGVQVRHFKLSTKFYPLRPNKTMITTSTTYFFSRPANSFCSAKFLKELCIQQNSKE